MFKTVRLGVLLGLMGAVPVMAQGRLSGETELGGERSDERFFSEYVFFDVPHVNVLTRYFVVWSHDAIVLHRGEFAAGPTFKVKGSTLKLQLGGTTDREVMVALTWSAKLFKRDVLYIGDCKISTTTDPSTLYQKLFVAIKPDSAWQFRAEDLQVGGDQSFLRLGVEYQLSFGKTQHLFVAPFFDPIRKVFGAQAGIRFF